MLGFETVNKHIERHIIEVAPLAFMRGRTLNHAFVILDEAQNTTREQMKMFLTRIGFGSTAVITGDTSQIDAPYLGETNNALAVLTNAFTGQPCFGHITLQSCERSSVASLAAELL